MKNYENFSPEITDVEEKGVGRTRLTQSESIETQTDDRIVSRRGRQSRATTSSDEKKGRRSQSSTRKNTERHGASASKKNTRTGKSSTGQSVTAFSSTVKDWANQKTLRLLLGIFLGLFGAYLCVAFVSYLSSCVADQSAILNNPVGTIKNSSNLGGEGGARISQFLINDTFGLGSIVMVIWCLGMAMKHLAGWPKFKSVNFTIKCIVALVTVSLIIGLTTVAVDSPVNWGGYHGRYVNEFIVSFFGWTGAAILCLFMIAVFVVICMRDLINWIMRIKRARDKRLAEERAKKAEEEAKREALRRDALREEGEARAAGEAPAMEEHPIEDKVVSFSNGVHSNECETSNSLPESSDDEEIGTYVLTDEEEILRRNSKSASENVDDDAFSSYTLTEEDSNEELESATGIGTQAKQDNEQLSQESASREPEESHNEEVMKIRTNTIKQSEDGDKVAKSPVAQRKYKFPPTELLLPGPERIQVDRQEQLENQERIRKTLLDFNIPIDSIDATVGPTVTLYEIVPATGVKVSSISNLVDDIALRLAAIGVRIIAPIPGRGTVGIEVANKDPQIVSMRSVLNSQKFRDSKYRLPIALGATIENDVFIADLAKMPHLLVAGATGQGKSVGLNAIIASLLYSKTPDELKFVMIDPKMVEFSLYAKIESHYLAKLPDESEPIITDMDKVVATLSSLCVEMDDRYRLLKGHARNVEEYNAKLKNGQLDKSDGHRFLPYIVVIVDEFSDLIMTAGKDVEMPIARLAQKARAVGMHVIIATQRPSTKVITGNIKANFPARISFKVTSGVDSKTILDQTGAQQLIGRGDMLISNNSEIVRVQCAFIDTPEVEDIVQYIASQPFPPGAYILPEPKVTRQEEEEGGYAGIFQERDPLLIEAARSVVMANQASTSSLQRRYAIGYNRAGKLMDQMEALGIVGPSQGGKPRSVLMDPNTLEDIITTL